MRTPYALALLAAAALPVAAQQPTRTLAKPLAEYGEPFSQIAAIRELKDGRLLVVDSRDKLVQLVDLTAKTATKVGREGSGPGEYGLPTQLFALPGDSSVIFDPLNQRYLMVHPDGKPGASFRVGDEPSPPPRPPQGQRPEGGGQVVRIGLAAFDPQHLDASCARVDGQHFLTRLAIDGTAPPGTEILLGDKPAGTVFTQANGQALAQMRFDRIAPDLSAGTARLGPLPE